jgi:serine protease Do
MELNMSGEREVVSGKPVVKRGVLGAGLLGLALAVPPLAAQPESKRTPEVEAAIARAMDLSAAFEHVAAEASPAVVNISARRPAASPYDNMFRDFYGRGRAPQQFEDSLGTGVIVSEEGYILTNNHVIEGATLITVKLGDNAKYTARLVGTDPETDVAVLKIEGENLPWVRLGDSERVRVGEWVIAVGNPFGLDQTVTAGIVSAKGRQQRGGGLRDVRYQDFIQTDASINPGNSGGPLLNLRGEVVGINSAILSRAGGSIGIGFAIPANLARSVMDSLVKTGEVRRSWLGVVMQDVTPAAARSFEFPGDAGVLVSGVAPGSPAEASGLKPGDIITRFDGRAVASREALANLVGVTPSGKRIDVELYREGKKLAVPVTVVQRDPQAKGPAGEPADEEFVSPAARGGLGVKVRGVTPEIAERAGLSEVRGVVVTEVERRSPAAMLGLEPGAIISSIDAISVNTAEEFGRAMERASLARGVRIGVEGAKGKQTLFLKMGR